MFMSSIRRWRSGLIVVAGMNAVIGRLLSVERSRNALPTPTGAQSTRCGLALICTTSHPHPSRAAGRLIAPPSRGRSKLLIPADVGSYAGYRVVYAVDAKRIAAG